MAKRRMFSLQIVDTDAFLEMPVSSQLLYFHLAMRADDEGFIGNPRKIVRIVGSNEDDFKVLVAKRFLLTFDSGVVVIKHWLIHNTIRMDRFNETTYEKEKKELKLNKNRGYTELATNWQPNDNHLVPQVKLSKVNLSKVKRERVAKATPQTLEIDNSIIEKLKEKGFPDELVKLEIKKFMSYWTEPNQKGKQRWQGQKFFDVNRRIATWFSRIAETYNKTQSFKSKNINLDNL